MENYMFKDKDPQGPLGTNMPLPPNDHQEMDELDDLLEEDIPKFQSMIGCLLWFVMMTLVRSDIIAQAVMTRAQFHAAQKVGHLEQLKHIYGYYSVSGSDGVMTLVRADIIAAQAVMTRAQFYAAQKVGHLEQLNHIIYGYYSVSGSNGNLHSLGQNNGWTHQCVSHLRVSLMGCPMLLGLITSLRL